MKLPHMVVIVVEEAKGYSDESFPGWRDTNEWKDSLRKVEAAFTL